MRIIRIAETMTHFRLATQHSGSTSTLYFPQLAAIVKPLFFSDNGRYGDDLLRLLYYLRR